MLRNQMEPQKSRAIYGAKRWVIWNSAVFSLDANQMSNPRDLEHLTAQAGECKKSLEQVQSILHSPTNALLGPRGIATKWLLWSLI